MAAGPSLRSRQRTQPRRHAHRRRLDRHRCIRAHVPRGPRSAASARPRHRRRPPRCGRAAVPAADAGTSRPVTGPRLRRRPRRGGGDRGEEPDARGTPEGCVLRWCPPPAGRRPTRRTRRPPRARARHARRRHTACSAARTALDTAGGSTPPTRRRGQPAAHPNPTHREPGAVLLLGLPAQSQHPCRARHPRRRRHRLPRDGGDDGARTSRRHRRAHLHGRRGRPVDRHGAVRPPQPPRAEHRRRHVLPLWIVGGSSCGRSERRHHLQAALQRHGGDDRRPGPRGADVSPRRSRRCCCSRASHG